jgi:hypothetical protein
MSITLNQEEMVELTGYQVPAWQIKWLDAHDWKYVVSAGGRPKVSRKYYEQQMGVISADDNQEPDFSIFHEAA